MTLFERFLGTGLVLLALADVFSSVLYARVGSGILGHRLACLTWRLFRAVAQPFRSRKDFILSLCGPVLLVLVVVVWFSLLTIGSALIIHPALGTSIRAVNGPTSTSLVTAMYIAGCSMTTAGAPDYAPQSSYFRLYLTFNSLIGISMLTLTLTYYLEIYNALQRRNTTALKLHSITANTADAAELIASLGAHDHFETGYTHLAEIAAEVSSMKESMHFYSALFYFRFREPYYDISRTALIILDTVTLIKSGLDDQKYAWLKESAAVEQMWRSTMSLLVMLADAFLDKSILDEIPEMTEEIRQRWHERYRLGLQRMRNAKVATIQDEAMGAVNYLELRSRWHRYIQRLAVHMSHDLAVVDPNGSDPSAIEMHQSLDHRLHAVS